MWAYPAGSIRGTWNRQECHLQALATFQDDGNVSRRYSTGGPRVTTPNEDRYLTVTAKRNRQSTASALFSHWDGSFKARTMYRFLG
ncbi:transposable element Tcb1 transposase [Trichonephila clavipes]|nr:transposable element Tcb1 transposase [Trichonephila clavipes]